MTDKQNHPPQQTTHKDRRWLPSIILFGLLLLNALLLFIPGDPLTQGETIFFWQRYNRHLYQLQCLILVLVPTAAILVGSFFFRRVHNPSLGLVIFLCLPCLFTNYLCMFVSSHVYPVGTVSFNGNVYHLVKYSKYDDPSLFYLGECDPSGYRCIFHEIYSFFEIDPGSPSITVSNDEDLIMVKLGNKTVYTYNGEKGDCIEGVYIGTCVAAPP
jgi:hypothetical protein